MPLQATSGAASYDAFGGGVAAVPNYIEDVFSTYLYTGNAGVQIINNGIDLSTKGGLVWTKNRQNYPNYLIDTVQTKNKILVSNSTAAAITAYDSSYYGLTSFNTNGYTLGPDFTESLNTGSTRTFVSWTFRKQPKFFDVVTYTGNGTAGRTVAHSLGSVPGCVIVKAMTVGAFSAATYAWQVQHRSLAANQYLSLNSTAASATGSDRWNSTAAGSTVFTLGNAPEVNESGVTYVAYLFAHDAGGFGLTGTDNVISCGSYTGVGGGNVATITLGYEPQWILVKRTDNSAGGNWAIFDNMRGMSVNSTDNASMLNPNVSDSESVLSAFKPTATGFQTGDNFTASGGTYIYIAIRRGPMKVPTSGTSVFAPVAATTVLDNNSLPSAGFPIDMSLLIDLGVSNKIAVDRLRGKGGGALLTDATNSELFTTYFNFDAQTNLYVTGTLNSNVIPYVFYNFRRAPSFCDVVCYTVSGFAANNVAHNLTVTPELFITKPRGSTGSWTVYGSILGATTKYMTLNDTQALQTSGSTVWGATSSTFSEPSTAKNGTYVCYLFATCAGVSKVFSYTGNGSSQTINCGFTAGSRWVMIKRTDSTGDWYVWDSARGIVSGNDPHLSLNSTAAEVTTDDTIDTDSTGFVVNQVSATNVNVSSATYIGIAIA